jgi:hypothetical protein
MSAQKMMVNAVDPDWKWLYRVGGISALVLGLAYIILRYMFPPELHRRAPKRFSRIWLGTRGCGGASLVSPS